LENDFIVTPGTNPDVIALAFEGAKKISVAEEGSLVLGVGSGSGCAFAEASDLPNA
jgi:hypothetical protein